MKLSQRLAIPATLALAVLSALPAAAQSRGFTVRDMVALERVSSPVLTPNGAVVIFAKREVQPDGSKATTSLWQRNLRTRDLAPPSRLTPEGWNVNSPSLSADGTTVYFLSAKSGSQQLYAMPLAGGEPRALTGMAVDVDSYHVSPKDDRIAFSASVYQDCGADLDCTAKRVEANGKKPASGVVHDALFVRHWDTWNDGRRNTLFVAPLPAAGAQPVVGATAISATLAGDVPGKPFGGGEDYTWSPDGKTLVASVRIPRPHGKAPGNDEPWSTNFDLYRLDAAGKARPVNLTASNPAWDAGPVFSADGKTLYYRAMKRPGFEADRFGLMALDLASGKSREIAPKWDRSADGLQVSADGKTLYVPAQELGQHPLFEVDIATGSVSQLVGGSSVAEFDVKGGTLAVMTNSLQTGNQLFTSQVGDRGADAAAQMRAITKSASELLPEVKFGQAEQFQFEGWNNETVHGYVVKPWNYEEGKTYPVAFLIHGGPQGSFGNGWSYRWNPQTYAGQGYAVVMIDFHGSTGYGQAFTDAISQHWGDRPLEDLQKGWAAAQSKYPFLNGDKACALGASYGGYMVYWMAGNWNKPWKCLVDHDGVFDNRMMGYSTEELWFSEWENGGTPWDNAEKYEKFNPVNHVKDWTVPMLVIHGQLDFRIPVEQGLAAFTAAQRKGVESKFLYFPDENHWVLKPANSVLWHDTVNDWLKQHIGQ